MQELRRLLSAEVEDGDRRRASEGWADAEEASELKNHNAALRLEVGSLKRALSRSEEERRRMEAEFRKRISTEKEEKEEEEEEEEEEGASWDGMGATGLAIDCMSSSAATTSPTSSGRSIVSHGGAGGGGSDLSGSWRAAGRTEIAIAQHHGDGSPPSHNGRSRRGSTSTASIASSWEPVGASGALMSHGSRSGSGGRGGRGTAADNGAFPRVGFAFPPVVEYTPLSSERANDRGDDYDDDYDDDLHSCLSGVSGMSSLTGTTAFALRAAMIPKASRLMRGHRSKDGRHKDPANADADTDADGADELRKICSELRSALAVWVEEEKAAARSRVGGGIANDDDDDERTEDGGNGGGNDFHSYTQS